MSALYHTDPDAIPEKRCTKCGNSYPATPEFFNRQKAGKYGVTSACKSCTKAHDIERDLARREKVNEQHRARYQANREHVQAQHKFYYQAHQEEAKERGRQNYQANKKSIRARHRRNYQDNKENVLARNKRNYQDNKESWNIKVFHVISRLNKVKHAILPVIDHDQLFIGVRLPVEIVQSLLHKGASVRCRHEG